MGPPKAEHKASVHATKPKPQPKAKSIPSTQGKSLTYGKGRSTVIDLGHNPSQTKIDTAANKLRTPKPKAKVSLAKVTKAITTKPSTSATPAAPSSTPTVKKVDTSIATSAKVLGAVMGTAAVTAGVMKVAGKAGKAVGEHTKGGAKADWYKTARRSARAAKAELAAAKAAVGHKGRAPVRKGLPKPLLGLPGPEKGLPAPKTVKASVLKELHDRSKPGAKASAKAALTARHDARRAKQGAGLKSAFEAAERADTRKKSKVGVKAEAVKLVKQDKVRASAQKRVAKLQNAEELRGKGMSERTVGNKIRIAESRSKGFVDAFKTQERLETDKVQNQRLKGAVAKATKGVSDPVTAVQKSQARGTDRRKPGSDPRGKADLSKGFGASEAEIAKVARSGEAVKAPTAAQAAANRKVVASAPKEVQSLVKQIERRVLDTNIPDPKGQRKTDGPIKRSGPSKQIKPAAVKLDPKAAEHAANRKAQLAKHHEAIRAGKTFHKGEVPGGSTKTLGTPVVKPLVKTPKAPKTKVTAKPAAVKLTGDQRQAANKAARAAIRAGDPVAAKKALAGLPETGRKAARYKVMLNKLKTGAVGGGAVQGTASDKPKATRKVKTTPAKPTAVKLGGAERQAANQAARAAIRAGDPAAAKKAIAALPDTGKKAIKYKAQLAEIAKGKAVKAAAAAPADAAIVKKEIAKTKGKKDTSYKQRKKNFRDRQNKIDPKTGKPMPLVDKKGVRTGANLMETTIEPHTPERAAAEARERAVKKGTEAKVELEDRARRAKAESQPSSKRGGKAPKGPAVVKAPVEGGSKVGSVAAEKFPEAKRVTANDAAHEQHQRRVAEGRQTENVNVKELAKQVQEKAKLGQADNMRQKMARGAAEAVLKQAEKPTSAAKPKVIKLTGQSSTPAPKVTKAEAKAQYKALKAEGSGVKSPTAGKKTPVKPAMSTVAKPKAPIKKGGEQLPRSQPKTQVIPSRAAMKAEQATAKGGPKPEAPKARKPMTTPVKRDLASNIKRYLDRFSKPAPPLKSPSIGSNVGENMKKPTTSKVARTIKGGVKAGALLTGLFALADAGVSAASEHDPSKRAGKAKKAFKESAAGTGKEVAKWTAAGMAASALPGVAGTVATLGLTTVLPAYFTYKAAKEFTIPKLKELGAQVEGTMTSRREAKQEKKASQAKYGSVEAATRTRHAKEALKKKEREVKKQKDLLSGGK
jgi:hypothetical protein